MTLPMFFLGNYFPKTTHFCVKFVPTCSFPYCIYQYRSTICNCHLLLRQHKSILDRQHKLKDHIDHRRDIDDRVGSTRDGEPHGPDTSSVMCSMRDEARMDYVKKGLNQMKTSLHRGDRVDLYAVDDLTNSRSSKLQAAVPHVEY